MDKIYSRPRIKLPKIKVFYKKNNNQNKGIKALLIVILIIMIIVELILNCINPMFEGLCELKAKAIAAKIVNQKTKETIENIDYNDLITIVRDDKGNITMVKANVLEINKISSELTMDIQEELQRESQTAIYIPMGSIFGNQILSNLGPKIKIKINPSGVVTTDFKSQFEMAGINQTIHRIYLYTVCKVNIVTPLRTISNEISNEVMVAESIIVGPVPDSYYSLEGLQREEALELVG